jgi:hypothetical protein
VIGKSTEIGVNTTSHKNSPSAYRKFDHNAYKKVFEFIMNQVSREEMPLFDPKVLQRKVKASGYLCCRIKHHAWLRPLPMRILTAYDPSSG